MGDTENYRTAKELRKARKQDARIELVLEEARDTMASLIAAMELDESQETVDRLVDRLWNTLRDHLGKETRLAAIVNLLKREALQRADLLTVFDVPPGTVDFTPEPPAGPQIVWFDGEQSQ